MIPQGAAADAAVRGNAAAACSKEDQASLYPGTAMLPQIAHLFRDAAAGARPGAGREAARSGTGSALRLALRAFA